MIGAIVAMSIILGTGYGITDNYKRNCNLETTICNAKYNSIYDGDTFYVDVPSFHKLFSDRLGVRIRHVDTPEMRGGTIESKKKAVLARDFVESLVKDAKKLDLQNCERGKFFRIICDVYADKINVGNALIEAGHAKPYEGGTR